MENIVTPLLLRQQPGTVICPCDEESLPSVIAAPNADDESLVEANDHSLVGLTELLLKSPKRIDRLTREMNRQSELIPRFLFIGLASFTIFSLALILVLRAAPASALPRILAHQWIVSPVASASALVLAYTLGFVIATGICLPSFYFYSLLAGVQTSWLQVTAVIVKGKGATALMLIGILPIYFACVLGSIVFRVPVENLEFVLYLGLALPFVAGAWGIRSIYTGFMGLADTLPANRRCRRECMLRRLTLSCTACYTVVTPVLVYRLWEYLTAHFAITAF